MILDRSRILIFSTIYLIFIVILFTSYLIYVTYNNNTNLSTNNIFYIFLSLYVVIILVIIRNVYVLIKNHYNNSNNIVELRSIDANTENIVANIGEIVIEQPKIGAVIYQPDGTYDIGIRL